MTRGQHTILIGCSLICSIAVSAGEAIDGRWATNERVCESENAQLLVVEALTLRWREAQCAVRTSYRLRDTWHISARCSTDGAMSDIPIRLELRRERLLVNWGGASAQELRRCP